MKNNIANAVLTVFIYAQGLLCVAAVATVMLRDRPNDTQMSSRAEIAAASTTVAAVRL